MVSAIDYNDQYYANLLSIVIVVNQSGQNIFSLICQLSWPYGLIKLLFNNKKNLPKQQIIPGGII